MNLRFVEAFYWVASLKSMSRAAEKLFITQSAMSSRIAALEEELAALLLDRQIRLTVAGSRFLVYAERLLAMQREIKSEMGSATARALSPRLGAIESVLHSWLIEWVQLVAGGFGVATLPQAAVQRLAERLPLKPLACEATLTPLPVHLSYRHDPSSGVPTELIEAVMAFAGIGSASGRATVRSGRATGDAAVASRRRIRKGP